MSDNVHFSKPGSTEFVFLFLLCSKYPNLQGKRKCHLFMSRQIVELELDLQKKLNIVLKLLGTSLVPQTR